MDADNEELNFSLSRFLLEVRKKSGEKYPAESLYEIVICLQLNMTMNGKIHTLLDPGHFMQLCNTLDNRMKELCKLGCVNSCLQTRVITYE